ncbi:MAG TPA: ribonuclease P protein component [Luteimonas sp.]|nr:ribonuclease P protein component [Luteimonas sp.]HRP73784.1 ribonuclease P protein component [Luteimonas sp.]
MSDARFPRQARVRARADFDRIFRDGRRVALPVLALHWLDDGQPPRLGLAVSRKVDPRAVGRNRIKRILRDHFRHARGRLAAGAYVLVARPAAASSTPAALREAADALLRRAGALPHPAADGTMPAADSRPATLPPPITAPRSHGE